MINLITPQKNMRNNMRNIEIKAKVNDPKTFIEKVNTFAKKIGVLNQVDYFFDIPKERGRLKLRIENNAKNGTLVFYKRQDKPGPKLSNYKLFKIDNPISLIDTLELAIGIKGKVRKSRTLYMFGQTRIHFDQVYDLEKTFMELEVVLEESQTVEDGQKIAKDIKDKLDIKESDLVSCAYFDMIYQK
jgi:predicted adenylyl cyclase CyaB